MTTTSESDTDSITLTVADTTPPTEDPHSLDTRTGEAVNSISGNEVHFVAVSSGATDVCDSEVGTQGEVSPAFAVSDGDTTQIQDDNQTVQLPTTTLELSVPATDHSGNSGAGQANIVDFQFHGVERARLVGARSLLSLQVQCPVAQRSLGFASTDLDAE